MAVVGDVKGNLQLWEYQTGNKPQPAPVGLRGKVTQLCTLRVSSPTSDAPGPSDSPVGSTSDIILAACSDGSVTVLDGDAKTILHCFSAHRGCVHTISAAWAPSTLLPNTCVVTTSSGDEGTVKVGVVYRVSMYSLVHSLVACIKCARRFRVRVRCIAVCV